MQRFKPSPIILKTNEILVRNVKLSTRPVQAKMPYLKWFCIPGPACSKLGLKNPGLVRNFNSDMKAVKANSVFSFCLPCDD